MSSTNAPEKPAKDMAPAWAGRRKKAAKARALKALDELTSQGYTVVLDPPLREEA